MSISYAIEVTNPLLPHERHISPERWWEPIHKGAGIRKGACIGRLRDHRLRREGQTSTWCTYIIECADGALYVGMTCCLWNRLAEHQVSRRSVLRFIVEHGGPSRLVGVVPCPSEEIARTEERSVASLLRAHASVPVGGGR
jgi:predicted GIY-YIG superfamily endonuclease